MAGKRMFSMDVINTDTFLDMPVSAQCLYFHLGMRADDDGFVSSPKRIMTMINCALDDIRILITKGYIIPFENGVVVITHWRQNNYVRCDRYTKSVHENELGRLTLENGMYKLKDGMSVGIPDDIPVVYPDKIRLDKNRIDKNRLDNIICPEPEPDAPAQQKEAAEKSGLLIPLNDNTVYDVPLDKITMWENTYLAVDVRQEIRKMISWCHSNPTKRKTRRGVDRFINSWLDREQNKGGSRTQGGGMAADEPGQTESSYDRWNDIRGCLNITEDSTGRNKDLPFQ